MAVKKATGKPFKKGQSGNPKGSSARMRDRNLHRVARLSADEVAEVGSLVLTNNREALAALKDDAEASVLKVWMAGLIVRSMNKGDATIFRAVMDRVIGKPVEKTEITGRDGAALALDVSGRPMTEAEIKARIEQLARQRQDAGDD